MAGARSESRYGSVQEAREQGISSYGGGYYEMAIDPLEYAASKNDFLARYYLARIYGDNSTVRTDHAKAYMLYQRLADEFADIDPDDDRRAPYIAKTLTALAQYLLNGVVEIGVKPDPERAADYLHHAATFFNDEDAQFQLAKLILEGSLRRNAGVRDLAREKLAIHWLSVLTTERRHASAQALLAYLMWRGEHEPLVAKDPQRALALATVAVENAPSSDRIWIEDYYQEIYCGISSGSRGKSDRMVQSYREQYGRQVDRRERSALGALQPDAQRTCSNGEPVPPVKRSSPVTAQQNLASPVREPFARGSVAPGSGFGLIDAGDASGPSRDRR